MSLRYTMTVSDEATVLDAFQRGLHDRREGVAVAANPYSLPRQRIAWDAGWMTEERFIRKQEKDQLSTGP